jgi:hypothetical protein
MEPTELSQDDDSKRSKRADPGSVKWRMRRYVISTLKFTADDVASDTGLNIHSVRSELARMVEQEYLTVNRSSRSSISPGAPANEYELTGDFGRRAELVRGLDALLAGAAIADAVAPASRAYARAVALIDQADNDQSLAIAKGKLSGDAVLDSLLPLLNDAKRWLSSALSQEGQEGASDVVKAHLCYQQARLAHLRGEGLETITELLRQAQDSFGRARDEGKLMEVSALLARAQASRSPIGSTGQTMPRDISDSAKRAVTEDFFSVTAPVVANSALRQSLLEVVCRAVEVFARELARCTQSPHATGVVRQVAADMRSLDETLWTTVGSTLPSESTKAPAADDAVNALEESEPQPPAMMFAGRT